MKHKETAKSFVLNIQKAMRVGGDSSAEYPTAMTQSQLSKAAGVARSTLAHHKEMTSDNQRSPNPTLDKICRIADTLNVPPAFLLMRQQDWVRLFQAIEYYGTLRESHSVPSVLSDMGNLGNLTPIEQAKLAFGLARQFEVDGKPNKHVLDSLSAEDRKSMLDNEKSRRLSIYTSSILAPVKNMNRKEQVASLIVNVIFGAHYKPETL